MVTGKWQSCLPEEPTTALTNPPGLLHYHGVTDVKMLHKVSIFTILCAALAYVLPVLGEAGNVPDERDQQVLEAMLLRLRTDPEFPFRVTKNASEEGVIFLHTRTPEKMGLLSADQIRSDIDKHTLPKEIEEDLRQRNTPPNVKIGSYDSVGAFYTNLKFDTHIVVTDLTKDDQRPNERGVAVAYLPGYSRDGKYAVVRASVGPSPHGATATALLEKLGDKWVVKWHRIAWYA